VSTFTELHQLLLDHHRFQLLKTEVGMGLTFADAAKPRYEAHNLSATMAMAHAEQAYDAMQLSASGKMKMSDEEEEEIINELHMLREKLNEINGPQRIT
jgi:hypothetical protein